MSADERLRKIIADNVAQVRNRIAAAAAASGRTAADVTMVAVTKYVGLAETQAVIDCGCQHLGESRPQDLWEKAETLTTSSPHWHLIGHLQRNKVRRTLPWVSLIHSVDSERLLREINQQSRDLQRVTSILLEVNVSGDASKHGVAPDELKGLVALAAECPQVSLVGLMAMSGLESNESQTRREFDLLRNLRDELRGAAPSNAPLNELSMGMSDDFELGIAAGATIVRIGSALFAGAHP